MRSHPDCPPARQRGAALLIILAILAISAAFLLVSALNKANRQIEQDKDTYAALAQTKEALVGWAIVPRNAVLGQMPLPDALDPSETPPLNYDGDRNQGCVFTAWAPGAALISNGATMRCLGRLPWRWLNMAIQSPSQSDPSGTMPWYAVSANLIDACFQDSINPNMLNWTWPGGYNCTVTPGSLQYPWLTVRDERGNVLSNRVAAVIIVPGPPVGGQTRPDAPLAGPAAYLDSATVAAGCAAPCVPGTYNNASLNPGNTFIMGKDSRQVTAADPNYTQPYNFNDKLVYITIDELMAAAEKRAASEARQILRNFFTARNYFPFAALLGNATGDCSTGNTRGLLPRTVGDCAAGDFLAGFPAWFTDNNWQNFIYYTSAPACIPGTLGCNGAGFLSVGAAANVRSLLITTGRPVTTVAAQFINGQANAMNTPPFAASIGIAQTGFPSVNVNDYLDSLENANGDDVYDAVGTARSTVYNDQMIVVAP